MKPDERTNQLFERELTRRGIAFERRADGTYQVRARELTLVISLENLARDNERDGDPNRIEQFVEEALRARELPPWPIARSGVLWSAEPFDMDFAGTYHEPMTSTVTRVLAFTDPEQAGITWLGPHHLEIWQVGLAELRAAALENLDRLLAGKTLEIGQTNDFQLGMIPVDSPFKASLILAPSLRRFVEPHFGWPVLAVIPCRDFVYLLKDEDRAYLSRLGAVVQREFRGSGYPITTEVLRISDDGIEAIGAFPR